MSVGLTFIEFIFEILGMIFGGLADGVVAAVVDNFITPFFESLSQRLSPGT